MAMTTMTIIEILTKLSNHSIDNVLLECPSSSGGKFYEIRYNEAMNMYMILHGKMSNYKKLDKVTFFTNSQASYTQSDMYKKIGEKYAKGYNVIDFVINDTPALVAKKPRKAKIDKPVERLKMKDAVKHLFE